MKSLALSLAVALTAGCAHDRPQPQVANQPLTMMPVSAIPSHALPSSWRDTPPPSDPHWPLIAPPDVRESRLPNGLTLYVITLPEATTVVASVLMRAGANVEPLDKAGLAWLTAGALARGAGELDEAALTAQLDRLGTSVASGSDYGGARLMLEVAPRHAERAVALLAAMVRAPRFDAAPFALLRQQLDSDLWQAESSPRGLATRAMQTQIFGAERRLALPIGGTRATIAALTVDDAREFARRWVAPNTTALVLAGQIDEATARRLAKEAFGSWRSVAKLPPPTPPLSLRPRTLQAIEHAGLTQALISLGRPGTAIGDDDAAPLELAAMVLGQLLYRELRTDRNLTYSVNFRASTEDNWGLLGGSLWVHGDAIAQALDGVAACMRRLVRYFAVDTVATHKALSALQDDLAINLLRRFDGVGGAVTAARMAFLQGLPSHWLEQYEQRVHNISGTDLRRVLARYFAPSELHVVVTAAPDKLRALKYTWPPELPAKKPAP